MRSRHRRTLDQLFSDPVRASIDWRDVESLLHGVGAELREGSGSRIRVELNGVRAVFHRPHPENELNRPMVRSVRDFFSSAGVR